MRPVLCDLLGSCFNCLLPSASCLLVLIVLPVAAPRVPAVGVLRAGLEADEEAARGARVDGALGERGLKDHRLGEVVHEARSAVPLPDREQVAERARKVDELFAQRGRREDLRVLREPAARDLRGPREAAVRGVDRVQVAALRVEHPPLAVGRARALIGPAADHGLHAQMFVRLVELRGGRGVREPDRRVERRLRLLLEGDAAALVLVEVAGLRTRAQAFVLRLAAARVEALRALVSLALALLLPRDVYVVADDDRRARPRVLLLPDRLAREGVEAVGRAVERRRVDLAVGDDRRRDNVAGAGTLPDVLPRPQVCAEQTVTAGLLLVPLPFLLRRALHGLRRVRHGRALPGVRDGLL